MKKEFIYTLELQNVPDDWLVYKQEKDVPDSKIAYQVELHAHGENAHRCSCEWGMRQPNGQLEKRCRHVQMVLEKIVDTINSMDGISDNVITLRDLSLQDMGRFMRIIE